MLTIPNPAHRFRVPARRSLLLALVCAVTWAAAHPAYSQRYTPPPPPLTTAPCVPTKKDPCSPPPAPLPAAAERFPFPGDSPDPGKAAPTQQTPADPNKPQAFPFPEDDSAKSPTPQGLGDGTSSSSSSSSGSTADDRANKDDDPAPTSRFSRKKLDKVEDKQTREEKDLEVSRYYASTGDYNAAYLRAKDAVASYPDDPEAHFTLAEMAEHLKKKNEAEAQYREYVKLEPDGDHIKYVAHALERLASNAPDTVAGKKK